MNKLLKYMAKDEYNVGYTKKEKVITWLLLIVALILMIPYVKTSDGNIAALAFFCVCISYIINQSRMIKRIKELNKNEKTLD
jgi:O-antigen/teichoic acid export membrane protein